MFKFIITVQAMILINRVSTVRRLEFIIEKYTIRNNKPYTAIQNYRHEINVLK